MKADLGIGIAGAGRAGRMHAGVFAAGVPGARLVAVADPCEESRRQACRDLGIPKQYADGREMAVDPDVDAVIVAAPTAFHREITVAAATAGKHVLCEKPMAMSATECKQMMQAAEKARVKLQVGFMRRFDGSFQRGWERSHSGDIGRIVQVKSLTHGPSVPKPWMYDVRSSNGPLAEVNSHDIDTLRWFTGSEVLEVYAIAGNYRCGDARESHPDFYDTVVLAVKFENGSQGVVFGAQGVGYAYDARCEVLGERGIVAIGGLGGSPVATYAAGGANSPLVGSWAEMFGDAYRAQDAEFVRSVLEDREPRVTGHDGRQAVRVVTAGNRSIVEGRPVKLEEVR